MLTKAQKKEQVASGVSEIKNSKSLLFADFTGVPTDEIKKLKAVLRSAGAKFKVFKKRLLKIAMTEAGVDVDPTKFDAQVGTVFAPKAIYDVASPLWKFGKDLLKNTKKEFKILGGYDAQEKKFFDGAAIATIAKLPSREVLLTQIAVMFGMPIKKVMTALNSRKEQLEKSTA
jgi:large subunit ribosomal protein L10